MGFLIAYVAALALLFYGALGTLLWRVHYALRSISEVLDYGPSYDPALDHRGSSHGCAGWRSEIQSKITLKSIPKSFASSKRAKTRSSRTTWAASCWSRPGVLRAVLLHAGLWGLGYLLRVMAIDGYLASMRTIHFAHWAIAGNGGRLIFFSNFDGSWESYLDDFIEKAHQGLTLAWTNGDRLSLHAISDGRRSIQGALIQSVGPALDGGRSFLVQGLPGPVGQPDRASVSDSKRSLQASSFERGGKDMGVGPVTGDTSRPQTRARIPWQLAVGTKIASDVQGWLSAAMRPCHLQLRFSLSLGRRVAHGSRRSGKL